MCGIKLTNIFEDAYNQQHADGYLSEFDVFGEGYDPHAIALFETREEAESISRTSQFTDNPDLTVEAI